VFNSDGAMDTGFDIGVGAGGYVNINPMPGFDFRVGVYPQAMAKGDALGNARYNFGAVYTAPDLVTVGVQVANGRRNNAVYQPWKATDALFFAKVLALKGMGFTSLNIDTTLENIQRPEDAKDMVFKLGEKVDYALGDLGLGIRFLQQFVLFDGSTPDKYTPDLSFTGYVQYKIGGVLSNKGTIVPRLNVGYNIGTPLRGTSAPAAGGDYRGNWDGLNKGDAFVVTDGAAKPRGFDKDSGNFTIQPNVMFWFGGSDAKAVELGYTLQVDTSKDAKGGAGVKSMNNVVYVNYRVAF